MKDWSESIKLRCPWHVASLSVWKKYPNPFSPQVFSVDVVDRYLDDSGRLNSLRLITLQEPLTWPINYLLNLATGGGMTVHVLERSVVDPVRQSHASHSVNLSMNSICSNHEIIEYSCDIKDSTKMDREVSVNVFSSMIFDCEGYMMKRYQDSRESGLKAINYTIRQQIMSDIHEKFIRQLNFICPKFSNNNESNPESLHFRRTGWDSNNKPGRFYPFNLETNTNSVISYMSILGRKFTWDDLKASIMEDLDILKKLDVNMDDVSPDNPPPSENFNIS